MSGIPQFMRQQLSGHIQYIQNLQNANNTGQAFNYQTGEVQPLPAGTQNNASGQTFKTGSVENFIAQRLPGFQPITKVPPPVNPTTSKKERDAEHSNMLSQMLILQFADMSRRLDRLQAKLDGTATQTTNASNQFSGTLALGSNPITASHIATTPQGGYRFSPHDLTVIRNGISQRQFSPMDLGEALMKQFRTAPQADLPEYGHLITELFKTGLLDPNTLARVDRQQMPQDRQALLQQAFSNANLNTDGFQVLSPLNVQMDLGVQRPEFQALLKDLINQFAFVFNTAQSEKEQETAQRLVQMFNNQVTTRSSAS